MGLKSPSPPRSGAHGGSGATRDQLLAAAGEVFAEVGYRDATVRDICRRAGANVAAIHYHFGGKEALYAEVLGRHFRSALERFPADGGIPAVAPPAERLRGFVRSFLLRIVVTGPDSCHGRLLAREMVDPTPALDALVATEVRALATRLRGILTELAGPGAGPETLHFCMAGVVSQIVFFQHCRPVITRMFPGLRYGDEDLERLADHITCFSLAGIREAVARLDRRRGGRRRTRTTRKP